MDDLWTAIGLVLFVEGVLYALFPGPMRRMMMATLEAPQSNMRIAGFVALVIGFGVIWLVRA